MAQIDAFFKLMNEQGASDLHMMAGQQPILRIRGEMEPVKYKALDNETLKSRLYEICPEEKIKVFAVMKSRIWPGIVQISLIRKMASALSSVKYPARS
jgi:Tfp pilus assembly pilus retraction ATPase PilT